MTYWLNESADDGFAAAALARFFVPSGGGYSALIAKMVNFNGGTVLRGGCELLRADFANQQWVSETMIFETPRGWLEPLRISEPAAHNFSMLNHFVAGL